MQLLLTECICYRKSGSLTCNIEIRFSLIIDSLIADLYFVIIKIIRMAIIDTTLQQRSIKEIKKSEHFSPLLFIIHKLMVR